MPGELGDYLDFSSATESVPDWIKQWVALEYNPSVTPLGPSSEATLWLLVVILLIYIIGD